MNYSFLYHAKLIESNGLIQSNNDFLYEATCIEEVFDLPQTCANVIFNEIYEHLVLIWGIRHMKYAASPQFIFLLTNGDYKCTCKLYNTSGWVCRHFFRVICITTEAKFHINMINHHWLNDKVYGDDLSSRAFIGLISANGINSATHSYTKWTSITTNKVNGFSKQEQELQLKAKQRFAKVFGIAKTMINKAIELDLDKKLIAILEDFREKEIKLILGFNITTCEQSVNESREANVIIVNDACSSEYRKENQMLPNYLNELKFDADNAQKRNVPVVAENPVIKRRKGCPQTACRVFNSIEVNQQSSAAVTKSKSITCTFCHKTGHNIRRCEIKLANETQV